MISDTLERIDINGDLNRKQLQAILGVSREQTRLMILGEAEPRERHIQSLVRDLPLDLAVEIVETLTRVNPRIQVMTVIDDFDLNHDGRIDEADALISASQAISQLSKALNEAVEGMRDGHLDNEECERIIHAAHKAQPCIPALIEICETLMNRRQKAT